MPAPKFFSRTSLQSQLVAGTGRPSARVTMALHLLLPLGLLWVIYAAGGYALRGLDALGPSADPTGIGMATRVSTGGMARNISRR